MDYADQSFWARTKRLNLPSGEEIQFNLQITTNEDTVTAFQLGFEAGVSSAAEIAAEADARIAELEALIDRDWQSYAKEAAEREKALSKRVAELEEAIESHNRAVASW